jgi:phenylacetate-CoA ligase
LTPQDIKTIEDMALLPAFSKHDLRDHYPEGCTSRIIDRSEWIQNRTSGSSGTPFDFIMDKSLTGRKISNYFRNMIWAGISPGDKYIKLWGPADEDVKKKAFTKYMLRRLELSCFDLDDNKDAYYDAIRRYRPKAIEAYPSALVKLCLMMREDGVSDIRIPITVTSAETLYEEDRKVIEETLQCRTYDRYGSREFGNIAQECSAHVGMHVNSETFLVEVVDPVTGEHCGDGEHGEILVTCFENFAMPFIRYKIGDMGALSHEACPCGMNLPLLKSIEGRVADFLNTTNKKNVPYIYFGYFLKHYSNYIKDFQMVQTSRDSFILKVVPTGLFSSGVAGEIRLKLSGVLGVSDLAIERVDKIELTAAGKKRIVIGLK